MAYTLDCAGTNPALRGKLCILDVCNITIALDQKDQAEAGGQMPLWHLSTFMNGEGTCTLSSTLCALRKLLATTL